MRRKSSINVRLGTQRAWFPKVRSLYQQITPAVIATYQDKLKKNPFAKAESEGEKAASELMQYVSYVSDHIPGSIGEIQKMRQEMFALTNCEGIPHIFLTLNPADSKNPIVQVL
ncbi:hypothetical protein FB45DRAFT_743868, partial [Roridomyces roridus]